jgi:uncharacterized protein DUF4062
VKIFLASTAQDLVAHRKVADDTILRLSQDAVVMERFGPMPGEPVEECERKARESDVVVCIVAHRYGFVPEKGRGSITRREVEAAKGAGKDVLVWIVADDHPWTEKKEQDLLIDPTVVTDPLRVVEVTAGVAALVDFKAWLRQTFVCDTFTTPDDLGRKIAITLSEYARAFRKSVDRIFETEVDTVKGSARFRVVRLFLSSPGDVREERDAAERAVHRFNQAWLEERWMFIKIVRWESMAPQIGPGPQSVVSRQLSQRPVDLFVGIMWNRFGTPTPKAGSGTEQEFQEAFAAWRAKGRPWIIFYFCRRPSLLETKETLTQRAAVVEFRDTVSSNGIVRDYESLGDFEEMLYQDLVSITAQPEFEPS